MARVWLEVAILFALILLNGLFAMAEFAILQSSKTRLKRLDGEGKRGAGTALRLAENQERMLSTVQVGITLIGILAGALGGATVARVLADFLANHLQTGPWSQAIAVTAVVLVLTYFSLVLGELVPKRLALAHPEPIARRVAGPLELLGQLTRPAERLLSGSTALVLRLFGLRAGQGQVVTAEEVQDLIEQGAQSGVFEKSEQDMVRRVFRLGDRTAGKLMTPRPEVIWIDVNDPPAEIRRKIAASPHSRFPVCEGTLDHVLGVVQVKDLLVQAFRGQPFDLHGILIMPLFVYEGTPGLKVLEMFKSSVTHVGIVLDEYGSVEGVITMNDILEALVGVSAADSEGEEPMLIRRQDGSWLVDGRMELDDLADQLSLAPFPKGDYHTLAGFVIDQMGRIPTSADRLTWAGRVYEVVDMDHLRVDKVMILPPDTPMTSQDQA